MAHTWRHRWRGHQFRPGAIGFLTNPYFLIRRHLWLTLRTEASALSGRILDVGCGAKPYRDLFPTDSYVGMDVAVSGHDHVGENIDVFYDGLTFPFPDRSFDVVFMSEVLEHVPDAEATLAECRRVLRADGQLLLTMPFLWGEHEMPFDFRRLTSVGLANMLQKSGFSVQKQARIGGVFETVVQLFGDAMTRWFRPRSRWVRGLRNVTISPALNVVGTLARWIGPRDAGLFLGHVALATLDQGSLQSEIHKEDFIK